MKILFLTLFLTLTYASFMSKSEDPSMVHLLLNQGLATAENTSCDCPCSLPQSAPCCPGGSLNHAVITPLNEKSSNSMK